MQVDVATEAGGRTGPICDAQHGSRGGSGIWSGADHTHTHTHTHRRHNNKADAEIVDVLLRPAYTRND